MQKSFSHAVLAEFQESRRQPVTVQDRVLRAYARTTAAVKRKQEEWKLRVELAEVAESAVAAHVAKITYNDI